MRVTCLSKWPNDNVASRRAENFTNTQFRHRIATLFLTCATLDVCTCLVKLLQYNYNSLKKSLPDPWAIVARPLPLNYHHLTTFPLPFSYTWADATRFPLLSVKRTEMTSFVSLGSSLDLCGFAPLRRVQYQTKLSLQSHRTQTWSRRFSRQSPRSI